VLRGQCQWLCWGHEQPVCPPGAWTCLRSLQKQTCMLE
jgi:hypothetical protein